MTPNVYVAASSKELARAERFIARIRALGGTIMHDWTESMRRLGPDTLIDDATLLPELLADLREGVAKSDLVIVLAGLTSEGRAVELGAAWGLLIEVWGVGDLATSAWVRAIANEKFATDDEALSAFAERVRWLSRGEQ